MGPAGALRLRRTEVGIAPNEPGFSTVDGAVDPRVLAAAGGGRSHAVHDRKR